MNYGSFTEIGTEYNITSPHPPRDWFNMLWNPTYLACVGQNLNGFSLYQSEVGVVTNLFGKQDQRNAPRNIYIRDNKTKEIWSISFQPTNVDLEKYKCTHGLGYTILESEKNGLKIIFQIFVPRKHSAEIWSIKVINTSNLEKDISIFSVSEVMLDGVNMTYGYTSSLDGYNIDEKNILFFRNRASSVVDEKYRAFTYTDVPYNSFDISKDYFLGKTNNYVIPEAIKNGKLNNTTASAEYMISALQHNLIMDHEDEQRINFVLGIVKNETEADKLIALYENSELIDKEFISVKKENLARLGLINISTPDKSLNNLFNVWLKHQLYLMSDWARFYFKGFRDTLQDAAGLSIINSNRAIEMLKKALSQQRSDGYCPRAFRVPSMDVASADKHYSDSPTWISHATDAILRETGDLSLLNEVVNYSDKGSATIWEHNLQALEFLWNDIGEHGLSLIRHGDWNDLMDKVGAKGRGEGIWISIAFARALKLVEKIAGWKGDLAQQELCAKRYNEIKKNIKEYGWDGDYFIYAFTDNGSKVGSKRSEEGQVFINPQSWAMLAGIIDSEKYSEIINKIEPILDTNVGPMHNWPPFTKYDSNIGQITCIPSGFFTNGNVYCHAATFKIAADFMAGRNEKAFETMKKILPSEEKSEPYAQSNGYVGPCALRKVKSVSDDPWRTGAVSWHFLNCFDELLGFNRKYKGVRINPKIPLQWESVSYLREFRGVQFEVNIIRAEAAKFVVDGVEQNDNFIEIPSSGLNKNSVKIDCIIERT